MSNNMFESLVRIVQNDNAQLRSIKCSIKSNLYRIGCYICNCRPHQELIVDGWRARVPLQLKPKDLYSLEFTKIIDGHKSTVTLPVLLGGTQNANAFRNSIYEGGASVVKDTMATWPAMTAEEKLNRVLEEANKNLPKEGTVGWYSPNHLPSAPWLKMHRELLQTSKTTAGGQTTLPPSNSLSAASSMPAMVENVQAAESLIPVMAGAGAAERTDGGISHWLGTITAAEERGGLRGALEQLAALQLHLNPSLYATVFWAAYNTRMYPVTGTTASKEPEAAAEVDSLDSQQDGNMANPELQAAELDGSSPSSRTNSKEAERVLGDSTENKPDGYTADTEVMGGGGGELGAEAEAGPVVQGAGSGDLDLEAKVELEAGAQTQTLEVVVEVRIIIRGGSSSSSTSTQTSNMMTLPVYGAGACRAAAAAAAAKAAEAATAAVTATFGIQTPRGSRCCRPAARGETSQARLARPRDTSTASAAAAAAADTPAAAVPAAGAASAVAAAAASSGLGAGSSPGGHGRVKHSPAAAAPLPAMERPRNTSIRVEAPGAAHASPPPVMKPQPGVMSAEPKPGMGPFYANPGTGTAPGAATRPPAEPGAAHVKMEPDAVYVKIEPGAAHVKMEPGAEYVKMEPGAAYVNMELGNTSRPGGGEGRSRSHGSVLGTIAAEVYSEVPPAKRPRK